MSYDPKTLRFSRMVAIYKIIIQQFRLHAILELVLHNHTLKEQCLKNGDISRIIAINIKGGPNFLNARFFYLSMVPLCLYFTQTVIQFFLKKKRTQRHERMTSVEYTICIT